jgi:small-conductance mechanosensitive channel
MEQLSNWFERVRDFLQVPIFRVGQTELTLWTFLYLIILLILLLVFSAKLKHWIVHTLLARTRIEVGVRQATGSILQYFLLAIGLLIILQTAGIDLTTLNILAGAVGIGVGFGLQNIANNFISGLIILFEQPIKVGDRIEVADVEGDVLEIGTRATTVLTNDHIAIIVPNSKFISENVINWSHVEQRVRFRIPVSVSYASDVKLVEKLLLEAAAENENVMKEPVPGVRFLEFGDSGLQFELRAWSTTLLHRKGQLTSELNFAILEKFREHGVEIPYPQRDLHLREWKQSLKPAEQNPPDREKA